MVAGRRGRGLGAAVCRLQAQRAEGAAADGAAAAVLVVGGAVVLGAVLLVLGGAVGRVVVFWAWGVDAAIAWKMEVWKLWKN